MPHPFVLSAAGDPMKSRTFRAGEISHDERNNSLWTETPADRAKRALEGEQVRHLTILLRDITINNNPFLSSWIVIFKEKEG